MSPSPRRKEIGSLTGLTQMFARTREGPAGISCLGLLLQFGAPPGDKVAGCMLESRRRRLGVVVKSSDASPQ